MIHYVEVLFIFAVIYLTIQGYSGHEVFTMEGHRIFVTRVEAFEFSLGTATTLGSELKPLELLLGVRFVELMTILFLLVVSFPRWLTWQSESSDKKSTAE